MPIRRLDRAQWHGYLDRVSKGLLGKRAEIEVASLDLGDQVEAEWMPLFGIAFDPKDEMLEIALDGLDHLIPAAREVWVEEGEAGLTSLEIIDGEGRSQIVQLREPLMLPAPPTVSHG